MPIKVLVFVFVVKSCSYQIYPRVSQKTKQTKNSSQISQKYSDIIGKIWSQHLQASRNCFCFPPTSHFISMYLVFMVLLDGFVNFKWFFSSFKQALFLFFLAFLCVTFPFSSTGLQLSSPILFCFDFKLSDSASILLNLNCNTGTEFYWAFCKLQFILLVL